MLHPLQPRASAAAYAAAFGVSSFSLSSPFLFFFLPPWPPFLNERYLYNCNYESIITFDTQRQIETRPSSARPPATRYVFISHLLPHVRFLPRRSFRHALRNGELRKQKTCGRRNLDGSIEASWFQHRVVFLALLLMVPCFAALSTSPAPPPMPLPHVRIRLFRSKVHPLFFLLPPFPPSPSLDFELLDHK